MDAWQHRIKTLKEREHSGGERTQYGERWK